MDDEAKLDFSLCRYGTDWCQKVKKCMGVAQLDSDLSNEQGGSHIADEQSVEIFVRRCEELGCVRVGRLKVIQSQFGFKPSEK